MRLGGERAEMSSSDVNEDGGLYRSYTEIKHRGKDEEEGKKEVAPLDKKKNRYNRMFGIKPWRMRISKSHKSHSKETEELYTEPSVMPPREVHLSIGNTIYMVCIGSFLYFFYHIIGGLLTISYVGRDHGRLCRELAGYFFWPFGKFIISQHPHEVKEEKVYKRVKRYIKEAEHTPHSITRDILWYGIACPLLVIPHTLAFILCWYTITFIPMAKVNRRIISLLFNEGANMEVTPSYPGERVLLCTYQATNYRYYKYNVGGMNVVLFNLIPFVLLTLVLGYIVPFIVEPSPILLFLIALLSTIPLAYYIGTAVSSIAAQTSFAMGAVLNSTFGSIVELMLYSIAIIKGNLAQLVQASVTGSLLAMLLLTPGLSMFLGGIKRREQRFNRHSASVSNLLLFVAIFGAFAPTLFYRIYANYSLDCERCFTNNANEKMSCSGCSYYQHSLDHDSVYHDHARYYMFACALILPLLYGIGLLFSLFTHTDIIYDYEREEDEEVGGHDAPEWSKLKAILILIGSTVAFGLISDVLVDALQPTLDLIGLSQTAAGITILAVAGSIAEVVNAIQFAMSGNMELSFEVSSAASVQICMIQMPFLTFFSAVVHGLSVTDSFILIFPFLDFIAVLFGVLIINYLTLEGISNYFKGASLVATYLVFIISFFFIPGNAPIYD